MSDSIEDFETFEVTNDELDTELHDNFSPAHERRLQNALKELKPSEDPKAQEIQNKWQGDIGEGVAIRAASEKLNLTPDPRFDWPSKGPGRGIDVVCNDAEGKIVVVESKLTEKGIHSLHKDQMQVDWVDRTASQMMKPGGELYSPGNAEIGAEIKLVGAENVRRVVIATHPRTLETSIFEGKPDGSWERVDRFSALDFEQPIPDLDLDKE